MSNKLFQNVIHQMKDSIDRQFGVIDKYNKIIACSEKSQIGKNPNVPIGASTEIFVHGDYTLMINNACALCVYMKEYLLIL